MFKVIMIVFIIIFFLGHLLRTGHACFHHHFPSTCHRPWVDAQWERRPFQCPGPPPSASCWALPTLGFQLCLFLHLQSWSLKPLCNWPNLTINHSGVIMHVVNWPQTGLCVDLWIISLHLLSPSKKERKTQCGLADAVPLRDKGFQTVGSTRGGELWRVLSSEIYGKPSLVPLESGRW